VSPPGFDAYMTGAIFAAYLEQIVGAEAHIEGVPLVASAKILQVGPPPSFRRRRRRRRRRHHHHHHHHHRCHHYSSPFTRITQYANTINQYGACSVLRLDRPEDENDFSNVFHVSINQRSAQAADVMTLFDGAYHGPSPFGPLAFHSLFPVLKRVSCRVVSCAAGIPVQLKWINKTSTWVIINDRSVVPRIWPLVKQQVPHLG
jgi:hypothetical protein